MAAAYAAREGPQTGHFCCQPLAQEEITCALARAQAISDALPFTAAQLSQLAQHPGWVLSRFYQRLELSGEAVRWAPQHLRPWCRCSTFGCGRCTPRTLPGGDEEGRLVLWVLAGRGAGLVATPYAAGHTLGGAVWRLVSHAAPPPDPGASSSHAPGPPASAGHEVVYVSGWCHRKERCVQTSEGCSARLDTPPFTWHRASHAQRRHPARRPPSLMRGVAAQRRNGAPHGAGHCPQAPGGVRAARAV